MEEKPVSYGSGGKVLSNQEVADHKAARRKLHDERGAALLKNLEQQLRLPDKDKTPSPSK